MSKIFGVSLALTMALGALLMLSIPASVAPVNSSNVVNATGGATAGQDPDLFRQTEPPLVFRDESRN
jgi:hypothetical protein